VALVASLLQLSRAIQPAAKDPVGDQEFRDLEWGQINFLCVYLCQYGAG
jgi:hypothetical protein